MQKRMPFEIAKTESFYEKLGEWIGDLFYDILPEAGFELRDEQIYMAFQLENAFKDKKVMFAEAGVGTGKTIVYLLYAIMYARYTNRPAVIACADETLIEQLVKKHNPEYLLMWQYPGLVPHEDMMRHIEMFATQVMPNWTDSKETSASALSYTP